MSKKHITAPLSYDPGKGRPKEYLAYLNWQEMQALQRLNGGNMERGPRGLPSFPPDDAIGSNQTPGSGNWTGSPGGTSVGSGPGGDVGGTTESGNIGGAGTSTSTTSSAASSAASTTSAASQNTTDEAAQQAAAVNNAAAAAKNAALNEDARRAGIGSIEVGPQRTPINIGGGAISAAVQTGIQQAYSSALPTSGSVPSGFMSPEQQMIDRQNTMYSPKALSELYKGIGAFGVDDPARRSKIQESLLGQTIELSKTGKTLGYKAAPNVKYSGSLDPFQSDVVTHWTGSAKTKVPALGAGTGYGYGIVVDPSGNVSYTKQFTPEGNFPQTWHTTGFNKGRIGIASIGIDPNQAQIEAAAALGREWFNPDATATSHGHVAGDLAKERRARGEKFAGRLPAEGKALASAFSGGLESPNISINSQFAGVSPTSVPSVSVVPASVELAGVEESYNPGVVADAKIPTMKQYQDRLVTMDGVTEEVGPEKFSVMDPADQAVIDAYQQAQVYNPDFSGPLDRTRFADAQTEGVGSIYGTPPADTSGQYTKLDVAPGEGYITHLDGTPFTAEDIANLPPDIKQEYMDKMRWARVTDEPYPLTTEQKMKVGAVGAATRPITGNPLVRAGTTVFDLIGTGLGYLKGPLGEFGEQLKTASERLSKPAQAVADYERLNPLQKAQLAANAGQTYQYGTGTSVAGMPPVRELGGKNYEQQYAAYSSPYSGQYGPKESFQTAMADDELSLRKQYLLWDKGIGIPEPGDPDYNDYMKYLESRGTSAQV